MKPPKENTDLVRDKALEAYKNDAFDNGFIQYFKERKGSRISQVLNDRNRKVTFKEITYRQISGWEKEGLLDNTRKGNEWRRFSIMDAIWLKIIHELRGFGMSWNQIKVTKESLEFQSSKCGVNMPLLEFYTAFAIANRMPVLILVFKDGVAIPANYVQYKVTRDFLGLESHIQLSLNDMLQGFFPDVDLKATITNDQPLELDEMELLAFIRLKRFEKIEIKYANGRMDLIEGLESINNKKRIDEILKEQQYASIELIEENGKVTRILRKIKKKIKREAP